MDAQEKARRIEKIRKCLRLAKSSNANEAAAALRQAKKMMEAAGVSESDIDDNAAIGEVVKTKEPFGNNTYANALVSVIKRAFGVGAVLEPGAGVSRTRLNVRYIGPRGRVLLAAYAHRVVDRAITKAWCAVKESYFERQGARLGFRMAFLDSVADQIEALSPSEDEAAAIDRYKLALYGQGNLTTGKARGPVGVDAGAWTEGRMAAAGFRLHRPMGEDRMAIGSDS